MTRKASAGWPSRGNFPTATTGMRCLVKNMARERYPQMEVCTSNEASGRLNFPRRAATCYYTAMTMREWNGFADGIGKAIDQRIPGCELHILKADGGTITLEASRMRPCETVFSGPAASTLGGTALAMNRLNSVVVDIGGTTSDISLLIGGSPALRLEGGRHQGAPHACPLLCRQFHCHGRRQPDFRATPGNWP